jgi:hypothetical protein
MDTAGRHAIARVQDHACRFGICEPKGVTKQKLRLAGLGKFGRPAKAPMGGIVALLEGQSRMAQSFLRRSSSLSLVVCSGRLFQRV